MLDELEEAVERRFLEERGDRFVFPHALARDALLASVSSARQGLIHARATAALQSRMRTDPLALARHARLGGQPTVAASALADAAALAAGRHVFDEAEHLLDEAIALDDRPDLHLARGKIRVARSDLAGAEADGEAASRGTLRPEGLALRAWVARLRHDMDAAVRLGDEGAATATDADTRVSCLLVVAMAHRGLGRLPDADRELADALAIDTATDLGLRGWRGVLRVHQGRPADALDDLEPAIGTDVDVVHGFWVEHVLQMAAHAQGLRGEPLRALAILDRLTVEMRRRGSDVRYRGLDDNYRAWILRNLGDPAAAELNEAALEQATMTEMHVQATLDLAATCHLQGRIADAHGYLAQADERLAAGWFANGWRCEQRTRFIRALALLADRDADAALAVASTLETDARGRDDHRYMLLAQILVDRARHGRGDAVDGEAVARRLEALPGVAGLEAWWLTGDTALDFNEPAWQALARERAATLAGRAGDRREAFLTYARRRLG